MAITTKNGRVTGVNDFTMSLPFSTGSIDGSIRAAVADLFSETALSATVGAPAAAFAIDPFDIVAITIPGESGPDVTFHFSPKLGPPGERLTIGLGLDVRPYLLTSQGRTTKIQPDKSITERSRVTLTFHEDGDAPDLPSASFTVVDGGEFWRRLIVAQPDYIGAALEVRRGFFVGGLPSVAFASMPVIFKGKIEGIDFQRNGSVSVIAKDIFNFRDINQPAAISDDNVLDGAIIASTVLIDVTDATQFTDPADLPSQDFFPPVAKIESELIIVGAIFKTGGTNRIEVAENFVDKSEEYDDVVWTKTGGTTVTPDTHIGPWGGNPVADTIEFAAVADKIEQITARVSATDHDVSTWMFDPELADGASSTITLEIFSVLGSLATVVATLTNKWKRFDATVLTGGAGGDFVGMRIRRDTTDTAKIVAWGASVINGTSRGSYAATDGNEGSDAGRGAYGTTAASHADETALSESLVYRSPLPTESGVHPVIVLRDLVNKGLIAVADVDEDSFLDEQAIIPSTQVQRAGVTEIVDSARLSELITEVREQGQADLWLTEAGLVKTRLSFRSTVPGETLPVFTDEAAIVEDSLEIRNNQESRVTQCVVFYDQKTGTSGESTADFSKVQISVDLGVEVISGPKVKRILAKWIERQADALALAGRIVQRFKRGARVAKLEVDLKDERLFDAGDPVALNTVDLLKKSSTSAARADIPFQVIQKTQRRQVGRVAIEALELAGQRQAFITPAVPPFPDDYDLANTEDRQFAFIGDSNNEVGADSEDGYYIV